MAPDQSRLDLLQGTLDLLILRALRAEPMHGWAISERIQQVSSDVLSLSMPAGVVGGSGADLKVLLTSGYTAAALSLEHGLPDNLNLVGKPYQREELAKQLRLVIGG